MCFVRGIKIRQRRRMRTVINSNMSGRKKLRVKSLFTRDIGVGRGSVLIISYLYKPYKTHTKLYSVLGRGWPARCNRKSIRGIPPGYPSPWGGRFSGVL